jgi:hypothetical protein
LFGFTQANLAQNTTNGSIEFSLLGAEFVDRTSIGFGVAIHKNWHEYFQIGLGLQMASNRKSNTFGYEVGSPFYTATAFTLNNTAQLYSIGNFSLEANANLGVLNINLQDEDFATFNPVLGIVESETIVQEYFRFLQGGFTLNYLVSKKDGFDILIFARALRNQSFGNVRLGGENGNSSLQFNLGIKVNAF